jgi:hypothetical protein
MEYTSYYVISNIKKKEKRKRKRCEREHSTLMLLIYAG